MAEINVNKKTVLEFLSGIKKNKFIIPDYQRPYSWDKEKCETLWLDIVDAFKANKDEDYFLGSIVSYRDKNGNLEIIDGQQRITSLSLLLRALYEKVKEAKGVERLKNNIESCIWKKHDLSGEKLDELHLESKVTTDNQTEIFEKIIKEGTVESCNEDYKKTNYYKNYELFKESSDKYATASPLGDEQWHDLNLFILNNCILLPIECEEEEIALTIFETLNDRGMPLANSDIFKAGMYRNLQGQEEKDKFIEDWKELTDLCENASISLDDIFRYYSHILRASEGKKEREIAIRKFYKDKKKEDRKEERLKSLKINELIELAKFWVYINKEDKPENSNYELSPFSKKYIQCLKMYPNDYWKYITSVYFNSHHLSENFSESFESFLREVVQFLFIKFIDKPTVNAIKDDIFNACINCVKIKNSEEKLFEKYKFENIEDKLKNPSGRIVSALLLLHAYLNKEQKNIIEGKLEIEHILPKKWQNTNFQGWNEEDAKEHIEKFGNKVIIGKKTNIQAGNDYFGQKKEKYKKSKIQDVLDLCEHKSDNWLKEDIENREQQVAKRLYDFFVSD